MMFLQLLLNEFKALLADKAIVLTVFVGVLFYAALYPLPYLHQVPTEQSVVVVDNDDSSMSRELIRHVDASPKIQVSMKLSSMAAAEQQIKSGQAQGILVIPAHFRRDLLLSKGATLSYSGDANYFLVYSAVAEGLVAAGLDTSKQLQKIGMLMNGKGPSEVKQAFEAVKLNSIPAFSPSLGYTPYIVPGLFLLILHQTLLIAAGILGAGQWRQAGYWQQVSPPMLVLARVSMLSLIYCFLSSFYIGFCFYWYDVSIQTSLSNVLLLMLPILIATACAGVALSCLFTRRDLPTQVMLLSSMPILFVTGFVWPLTLIPDVMQWFSQIIPAVPAIKAMLTLNQMGADWGDIMPQWLQLWALAAVYFILACAGVKWRHSNKVGGAGV